jgi:hypothetical protein
VETGFRKRSCSNAKSNSTTRERHAIRNRKHDAIDPLVDCDLRIQCAHRGGARITLTGVRNLATLKHVVEDDHPARADQPKGRFVVAIISRLVGINEHEVEAGSALPFQPIKRSEGQANPDLDLVRYACPMPKADPILTISSLTSQVMSLPSSGSANAIAMAL